MMYPLMRRMPRCYSWSSYWPHFQGWMLTGVLQCACSAPLPTLYMYFLHRTPEDPLGTAVPQSVEQELTWCGCVFAVLYVAPCACLPDVVWFSCLTCPAAVDSFASCKQSHDQWSGKGQACVVLLGTEATAIQQEISALACFAV